jgi:chemotaxis family two-component system response regulator Rcp1
MPHEANFVTAIMVKNLLLVEDDDASQMLMKQAIKTSALDYVLNIAGNGEEALDFLNKCGPAQLPDLILLDLNLPGKNGLEILKEIRANDSMSKIPVLVLTGSNAESDRSACNQFAHCRYVLKPSRFFELVDFVKSFQNIDL